MLSVYAYAMPCHAMIYQFKEMPRVYDAKNALSQTMQQREKDEKYKNVKKQALLRQRSMVIR